ncbi:MAG: phosphotransferase family protein [Blastocatellia bacterium]
MNFSDEFRERLGWIIAERLGPPGEVRNLRRLTGGATRITWSLDALIGDRVEPLILQQTSARQLSPDDPISRMARIQGDSDARLMIDAARSGVPVSHVRLILGPDDGLGVGFITDRIEGETIGRRVIKDPNLAGARSKMASQCGQILTAIHSMDTKGIGFLVRQDAMDSVAAYRDIWNSFDCPVPAMEFGFKWATAHIPKNAASTLVHGDFRNGNFIVGPDGIRAVLDWELAHIGDPMEDLGWLLIKTWRFGGALPVGGFGSREELFESYERSSGNSVSPEHVMFWEAFGCLKWAVMCMIKAKSYKRDERERTVEALAIGRRMEEPLYDFLNLTYPRG